MAKLIRTHKFKGKLKLKTGLHIGGSKDSLNIGGVDSPVIKVNENGKNMPYIPGSSLKGKLRCLLELKDSPQNVDESGICVDGSHMISKIFGCHNSENIEVPGALIVADAFLMDEDKNKDLYEIKYENTIDRAKGTTKRGGLRQMERVNPGLTFEVELVLKEFEGVEYGEVKSKLIEGLKILSHDYLGGSGTRGYGQVDVSDIINKLKEDEEVVEE